MNSALPKKILMTADTVGGVWTYALQLAHALRPHGIEVLLATMGTPPSGVQRREARLAENVRLFESNYKLEWMEDPWLDIAASGEWLAELDQAFQPDLIHLNGYAHASLAWRAPTIVVGHSCVLSWWEAVRGGNAPAIWDDYRQAVRAGLKAASLVIAPSRTMLGCLEKHYGPVSNGRVIPNGRALSKAPQCQKEKCVLAAGRIWDEAKNVSNLARISAELSWPVYIAGERKPPGATDHANAGPKGESPIYLGQLSSESLISYYSRASIFASPAVYEPFGLTALEAALAGCALVLGDISSLREIWGNAAFFVPPHDSGALRACLENLIRDPRLLREMAGKAESTARRYSPEIMAQGYLTAYAEVIAGHDCKERIAAVGSTRTHEQREEMVVCAS